MSNPRLRMRPQSSLSLPYRIPRPRYPPTRTFIVTHTAHDSRRIARSPRVHSSIGGSRSSAESARKLREQGAGFPPSIWNPESWCHKALTQTSVFRVVTKKDLYSFWHNMFESRYKIKDAVETWWRKEYVTQQEFSKELTIYILRCIGLSCIRESEKDWQNYGLYCLTCAVELGDETSALHLVAIEARNPNRAAPLNAQKIVKELAQNGLNWKAMALQVALSKELALKKSANRATGLAEALKLADELVDMTEPDNRKQADDSIETVKCDPPWRLLWELAQLKGDAAAELKAITLGAERYNDPEACAELSRLKDIEMYSQRWVELTTKAAMGGSNMGAWALGKYWLEKKGWYPCTGGVTIDDESQMGFDWFEIAAVGRPPLEAAKVYLPIAFVCRENNCSELGLSYLENAVAAMRLRDANPEKDKALGHLEQMITDWSEDKVFEQVEATAAYYVGPPRMPTRVV